MPRGTLGAAPGLAIPCHRTTAREHCGVVTTEGPITPLGPDRTVEQMLVRELRALIVDGKLAPGARLTYRSLAEEFGVSITPVRIALRDLAKEGLVEARTQGGVRVAALSLEELEELYATRVGIESWLARRGAERLEDSDLRVMESHFRDVERAVATRDRPAFLHSAWAYRCTCYRKADRERLLEHVSLLFRRTTRYNELALFPQPRFDESLAHTREFGEACARRDGRGAQRAIRDLLDDSLAHLVEHLPSLDDRYDGS